MLRFQILYCRYVKAALTYLHMLRIPDIERLREVALDQHGLVTASQAEDAGVSRPSLSYLTKNNRIERVDRGIYRIPQVPHSPYDMLQQALLWAGEGAILSHDTALAAWDVCDINPMVVHVTVPKARRIKKAGQQHILVHKDDVPQSSIKWWEGMPTACLELALQECIDRGVPSHIVDQAIQNGRSRALIGKESAQALRRRLESRDAA